MVYAKKLIILTGAGGTGAVNLEKSAAGLQGRLNTYELPDLARGYYVLAFMGNRPRMIDLGEAGRMTVNFSLDPETDITALHCAVARIGNGSVDVMLYGTLAGKKMWSGDVADHIRRKIEGKASSSESIYSKRKIEDYFFDILPASGGFHDGAVAKINYYAPDFKPEESAATEAASPASAPTEENAQAAASALEIPPLTAGPVGKSPAQAAADSYDPAPSAASVSEASNKMSASPQAAADSSPAFTAAPVSEAPVSASPVSAAAPNSKPETAAAADPPPVRTLRSDPLELEKEYLLKLARSAAVTAAGKESAAAAVPQPKSDSFRLADAPRPKPLTFYELIKPKLDKLFAAGTPLAELENIMPDTRWIRVDYDGKRYYAVGLIGTRPDYVCYGVPARFTPEPPEELRGYCNWLPTKGDEPQGDGYWLMFQDADNGASVTPEV